MAAEPAFRLLGSLSAFPGPLPLSRCPSLESCACFPWSRARNRHPGSRARTSGCVRTLLEGLGPLAGSSPRLAYLVLGSLRQNLPQKLRQPASRRPSSRPPPRATAAAPTEASPTNPRRGGGVAASGRGGRARHEQTEKVTIFITGGLALPFIFFYPPPHFFGRGRTVTAGPRSFAVGIGMMQ